MLQSVLRLCDRLSGALNEPVASVTLVLDRIPGETGGLGPPGSGFILRSDAATGETLRPAGQLLREARLQMS